MLRTLAWLSPLWHGVELARDATTGHFDIPADIAHIAVLMACIAVGALFGVRSFARRLGS